MGSSAPMGQTMMNPQMGGMGMVGFLSSPFFFVPLHLYFAKKTELACRVVLHADSPSGHGQPSNGHARRHAPSNGHGRRHGYARRHGHARRHGNGNPIDLLFSVHIACTNLCSLLSANSVQSGHGRRHEPSNGHARRHAAINALARHGNAGWFPPATTGIRQPRRFLNRAACTPLRAMALALDLLMQPTFFSSIYFSSPFCEYIVLSR